MKRVFFVFLAVFFSAGLSLQAQNWSIPKESSEVNWATPERSYNSILEDPVGRKWSSDKTFTLRIPNEFANDAPINRDSKYTFAFANPIPSKGYTTTTFVYGPDSDNHYLHRLKTSIMIGGEAVVTPQNKSAFLSCTLGNSKQECETLYKLPGANFTWICNFNSQITYVVARAKDDPSGNTLILWAIYSSDSRYKGQSSAPAKSSSSNSQSAPTNASQTNSSGSWTDYANAYAFSYNDENVHTYTLLVPNNYKNGFKNSRGEYEEIANPKEQGGYTTLKFRAYMENDRDRGEFWLHFKDSVSFSGNVAFPADDFAKVDKKEETSFYYDDDLSFWPNYLQSLFSSEDKRSYYFVRSKKDPYTIILWGINK